MLDVLVVVDEEIDVALDVLLDDDVDDVVVLTDVVAVEVSVDVGVVEGEVTSQFRNDPSSCRLMSSLKASASSCERDSPVAIASFACRTASMMWTLPLRSCRHPISKKMPLYSPSSNSVISRSMALSPGAVRLLHESRSPVASTRLYRGFVMTCGTYVPPEETAAETSVLLVPLARFALEWGPNTSGGFVVAVVAAVGNT